MFAEVSGEGPRGETAVVEIHPAKMGAGVGYWFQETLDTRCYEPDSEVPKSGNSPVMNNAGLSDCSRRNSQSDSLLSETLVKVHALC
jgi:hypothetical protein